MKMWTHNFCTTLGYYLYRFATWMKMKIWTHLRNLNGHYWGFPPQNGELEGVNYVEDCLIYLNNSTAFLMHKAVNFKKRLSICKQLRKILRTARSFCKLFWYLRTIQFHNHFFHILHKSINWPKCGKSPIFFHNYRGWPKKKVGIRTF